MAYSLKPAMKRPSLLQIYGSVMLLLLLSLIGYVVNYTVNSLVANRITPEFFGDFSIAVVSIYIVAPILLLGSNSSSVKFLSVYLNKNEISNSYSFFKWNFRLILRTFVLFFIIFSVVLIILQMFREGDSNVLYVHPGIYCLAVSPLCAFSSLLASYLLANKHSALYYFFSKIAFKFNLLIIFLIFIVFLRIEPDCSFFLYSFTASFTLIIVVQMILVKKALGFNKIKIGTVFKNWEEWIINNNWLKTSFKLLTTNIIQLFLFNSAIFIVELVAHNEAMVGEYSVVITITSIIWLLSLSVSSLLAPYTSTLIADNKITQFQYYLNIVNLVNSIVLAIVIIIVFFFSGALLSFFGEYYVEVKLPLKIQCIAYAVGGLILPPSQIMLYFYTENQVRINAITLVVLLVSCSVLTYFFGIVGTAGGELLTFVIYSSLIIGTLKVKLPRLKPLSVI